VKTQACRKDGGTNVLVIREALVEDLPVVADIYRECFGESGRARLGQRTVLRYFRGVAANESHTVYVAQHSTEVAGFAVLVTGSELVGRQWLLGDPGVWREIAWLCIRRPGWALGLSAKALGSAFRKRAPATLLSQHARFASMKAAWLELIGVSPRVQGKGLGAALLGYILKDASEQMFECVKLRVDAWNTRAIGFYERSGFLRTVCAAKEYTYARECAEVEHADAVD